MFVIDFSSRMKSILMEFKTVIFLISEKQIAKTELRIY